MAGISDKTISKLFGMAAGRCSMCKIEIVQREVKIGEMAHIIAKNKGGARGGLQVDGDVNGYENLILLCPNHHTEVDDNEGAFPARLLHKIKDEHEAYVRRVFDHQSQGRVMDVGGLRSFMHYFPFTQVVVLTDGLPERFDHRLLYLTETFTNFAKDNVQCRPFSDQSLERYYLAFLHAINYLVDYEQHALINNKNVYMPGTLINADPNVSYLNRELNQDERRTAHHQVHQLMQELADSYYPLLSYLRSTYPEVNLVSFVGW
ncbi:HNH endonuclease signature motif containing protein [Janthinobacterium sp. AD80]|uniref:HNH endonuclease signature motif containing protein n=1 Tax=Janthinobacterium sp. AD80 TaxID=1528773 RepID=UPI000CB5B146|nr:HNH endonuclease signature motif containing protein [Janthinobacterium sp. AD80]PMQ18397.1 hypothetical protein JaAD80_00375 [Janthinobacterium sp. AD80]